MLSLCLFFVYVILGLARPGFVNWSVLVLLRFVLVAAADTLGEGLMVLIRQLEENAKDFFDEVDTLNIVGTYITCRGFSRAIFSTIGAYVAGLVEAKTIYLIAAIAPLAIAVFARETFHELKVDEVDFLEVKHHKDDDENGSRVVQFKNNNEQSAMINVISTTLRDFLQTVRVQVVWIHFILLLLVSILPVGDLSHRQSFLKKL